MKQMKKRLESLFLCLLLLMSTCLGQCHITREAKAAEDIGAMRNLTSMELVQDMTLGWNLGNSLDSCIADRDGDGNIDNPPSGDVDETLWGNIWTTPEIFTSLKNQGFNAVRIPVTWRDHLGEAPDYLINEAWMNRVQEVVDYAYDQDMYVIIDLHHDGGDDLNYGAWIRRASIEKKAILEKYTAIWNQIAERFQDYSDHLIFESVNEIGFDDLAEPDGYKLLNEINQTFVDLIRSSGGNNAKRHLLIGGYWTDISATCNPSFQMPEDPQNRCILSLHYYTPWQFCTTNLQKTWGSIQDGEEMQEKLDILKETFLDQGIPVIIGEFGVGFGTEAESRIRFCSHFISRCKAMGVPCFYWDNGEEFDRSKLKWRTEGLAEAMLQAAGSSLSTTPEPTKPVNSVAPTSSSSPNVPSTTPAVKALPVPAVGSVIKNAAGSYQITKRSTGKALGAVSFKKAASKNIKQATIPATVTLNNLSYQVTAIQKNAFQNCKKLKKVTIGSNVTKIGTGAFQGCKKLKTIRVNTPSLKSVGKKAFRGIGKAPVIYVPGNKIKTLRKKLGISGLYKKQILLNCTSLTVMQGATNKKLDTLKVIGSSKKAKWISANKKIATVNSNGLVQGVAGGKTTITAKVAGKKLTCKVKVNPVFPVPMPAVSPAPSIAPTAVPTPKPKATETPKWTPMPLYSSEPDISKNQGDVAVLKNLAEKYPDSIGLDDLNSWHYQWNDEGRLTAINWGHFSINGTLEISGLSALQSIELDRCDFMDLKISNCESLRTVSCSYNLSLKKLDLSKAVAVSSIRCLGDMKELTEVLISDNTKIQSLSLGDTPKLEWDFAQYPNLESLLIRNKNETDLDLSSNKKLTELDCSNNQLSSLKISEGIEVLKCDNNDITALDLSKSTNLQALSCFGNQLSSLDLSNNTQLDVVNLTKNQLNKLDFSSNTNLLELQCQENKLTELVLDSCNNLKLLDCNDNLLTGLDLSTCTSLENLNCSNNSLTMLDFGTGKALQYLNCENNQLEILDLVNEKKLVYLYCSNNQLTKLEIDSQKIWKLACASNQLTQLDIGSLVLLENLDCSDNKLRQLDFSQTAYLEKLHCSGNQLSSLEIDSMNLYDLDCSENPLNVLNISGCQNLQYLNFYHTDIASLDVTDFKDLENIYCNSADLLLGWKYLEKDASDVAALESLMHTIQKSYEESGVSDDEPKIASNYLVNPQYKWKGGKLIAIHWDHCSLTGKLDVSELKNLQELSCRSNALEQLEISGCKELMSLDCRENKLTEIDASQNTSLFSILCDEDVTVHGMIQEPGDIIVVDKIP